MRTASGARHSAPATAPAPWAVVSTAVVAATAAARCGPLPCDRLSATAGTSAMKGAARNATAPIAMVAARQDGSARTARRPSLIELSSGPWLPGGGPRRMNSSAMTTARKLAAFATKLAAKPKAAMAAPASAGPAMRPAFHCAELSELAARNSDRGTRSGRIAWTKGPISAATAPCRVTRASSAYGLSWPAATRAAMAAAISPAARFPAAITGRRGSRSASAPPSGDSSPIGRNAPAATSTAQLAEPVLEMTSAPTATVCIQLPTFEIRLAVHSTAKLRCLRGLRAAAALTPIRRARRGRQ